MRQQTRGRHRWRQRPSTSTHRSSGIGVRLIIIHIPCHILLKCNALDHEIAAWAASVSPSENISSINCPKLYAGNMWNQIPCTCFLFSSNDTYRLSHPPAPPKKRKRKRKTNVLGHAKWILWGHKFIEEPNPIVQIYFCEQVISKDVYVFLFAVGINLPEVYRKS